MNCKRLYFIVGRYLYYDYVCNTNFEYKNERTQAYYLYYKKFIKFLSHEVVKCLYRDLFVERSTITYMYRSGAQTLLR